MLFQSVPEMQRRLSAGVAAGLLCLPESTYGASASPLGTLPRAAPFILLVIITAAMIALWLGYRQLQRMKTSLANTEAYNRMLFNQSAIGLALCRFDGSLVDVNPAFAAILGRTIEETLQLKYWDITPEDYAEQEQIQLQWLQTTGHYGPYEKEYIHRDGHRVPVRLSGQKIERDGQQFIWSSVEDISDKVRRETALRRRSRQLEILSQATQRINQRLEIPTIMHTLVEAAIEITGASDGTAGLLCDDQMIFTEYYTNGHWVPMDFVFPAGYGVPGWVIENRQPYLSNDAANDPHVIPEIREKLGFYNLADTPILNRSGELLGCFEIHNTQDRRPFDEQDILVLKGLSASAAIAMENARILEERDRVEQELRQSESKFRSLFEDSPVALWEEDFSAVKAFLDELKNQEISDPRAYFLQHPEALKKCASMIRVLDVNKATLKLFQARDKDELLISLEQTFAEKSLEWFCNGLVTLTEGATRFNTTGINRTLSGRDIEVDLRLSVAPGFEKNMGKVIVSMIDVTRERELDRMKNEFISTAAHELRTPLTTVMGFSELLATKESRRRFSSADKEEFLRLICEKARNLERIVDDLLDVSHIESGRPLLLAKTHCPISELLESVVPYHQKTTVKHEILIDCGDVQQKILMDPDRMAQVLDNLLSNAIKYSPAGGTIAITGRIRGDNYEITISDQGIGMNPEQLKHIFDKFYRADASNTAIGGLGLGMSIVQNIVERHGGTIQVESVPSQGTRVSFSIPLTEPTDGI